MPRALARGVDFHVQELGRGRPLVMLHGLLVGSLATWWFGAAPALAQTRRVILFDLRGHGLSARAASGYDVASMSADLEALAPEGPIALAGHSWGALVALRFALDHPERVERLALVEAPLPPSRLDDFQSLVSRTPAELLEALPAPLASALPSGGRRGRRLFESLSFLLGETTLLADLGAERDVPDAELARVACPVLAVYGDRSSCLPVGERLARVVPNAQLRVLQGGHYLHLDAPAALSNALVEFFGWESGASRRPEGATDE